jgi:GNAT superfamily N-acetyltransferase
MTTPGSEAGDVEEIDARTASDDVLGRFHAVELACHHELHPGEPVRSRDEAIAFYRHQPTTHTSCHWLADGGGASLYVHGPRAAFLHLLVEPRRRRHGIGGVLLGQAQRRARELGVDALRSSYTTDAGAAFATHVGAVAEARVVQSVLDLRAVELPEPRVPADFRLLTWLGRVPDEYLADFVEARAAMDDAPEPEGLDIPVWTAETVRASEESLGRRHREMRVTVAIAEDASIGAFTELRVSRGSTLGFTDDTGTVEVHRGKGLARAVKIESLRRLHADHPEVETVSTSNAEENIAMRHVNESIGFRPTVVVTSAVLVLAEP